MEQLLQKYLKQQEQLQQEYQPAAAAVEQRMAEEDAAIPTAAVTVAAIPTAAPVGHGDVVGWNSPPAASVLTTTADAGAAAAAQVGHGDEVGGHCLVPIGYRCSPHRRFPRAAIAPAGHESVLGGGYPPVKLASRVTPAVNVLQPDVNLDSAYKNEGNDDFLEISLMVPCTG